MSDLKPLREALAKVPAEVTGDPHWMGEEQAFLERTARLFTDSPMDLSGRGHRLTACLLGYQCRQPEIDALAKSNAELLEALRLSLPYIESDSRRGYDGTNGNGIRAEAKRRLEIIQQAITNAERKDGV